MSELHRRVFVRGPTAQAPAHLNRFFSDCADGRHVVRFAFRAPVHIPGLETDISMQRDIIVIIAAPARRDRSVHGLSVEWSPADDGPFPRFHGTLGIRGHDTIDFSALVLQGHYDLPAAAAGDSFDAGIGHRIAQATARELLAKVCSHLEGSYRAMEASKRAR